MNLAQIANMGKGPATFGGGMMRPGGGGMREQGYPTNDLPPPELPPRVVPGKGPPAMTNPGLMQPQMGISPMGQASDVKPRPAMTNMGFSPQADMRQVPMLLQQLLAMFRR